MTTDFRRADTGIRVPDSGFIREVCRRHGGALALTSANLSGAASPLDTSEFRHLWPRCAAVFDGGRIDAGRSGSTVLDLSAPGVFRIARSGADEHVARYRRVLTEAGLVEEP